MSLYTEHRFTKLWYAAASIVHVLPLLMLLNETDKSNLLAGSCKLYLESEFFITELKLLEYFTYKVTLPFLYFMEISEQTNFLRLYNDHKEGKINMLEKYLVKYLYVVVEELSSILEKEIIHLVY